MDNARPGVLIIDDEKMSINVLSHILNQDYTIYTARDGQTGLEIAEEYVPNLILLDIVMPGMDGYEVIAKLRESEVTKDIPVIFITGLTNNEDIKKALAIKVSDYIFKPVNAADVKSKVDKHIKSTVA